jgi:uncharacterized membrane protein YuzA (DUF378 family)
MDYSKILLMLVQVLVIAGALNWGLVAFNGTDLVQQLTGGGDIEKYVKFAVAAAGIYLAYTIYV